MTKLDNLLYGFLVEESGMQIGEFKSLTEEFKSDVVIEIANTVLANIKSKLDSGDTFLIDRSKGDIKNFPELSVIQDTLSKINNIIQSVQNGFDEASVNPLIIAYIKEITNAIINLHKMAPQYKDAYRTKKTLLIMSYQSVVLSIISSLSYLISVAVDFKDQNLFKLKANPQIEEILPYKSLVNYNNSINNGAFTSAARDVVTLREFYNEYSIEQMSTILEAIEIVPMINKGIDAFSNFIGNNKRNGIIFKVLGIVMIILSLRDTFYSLYTSRIKLADKLSSLKSFIDPSKIPSISALSRYITFNNKNAAESVYSSNVAKKEIADENKEIINMVKSQESENAFIPEPTVSEPQTTEPAQSVENIFADFNF